MALKTPDAVVVLDNGAGTAKIGLAGEDNPRSVVPNCTGRLKNQLQVLVADQIQEKVRDASQLLFTRPFDRGYIVNWNCEREIWDRLFGPKLLNINPTTSSLLVTGPPLQPRTLADDMFEEIFEEYGFHSCCLKIPAELVARQVSSKKSQISPSCQLVIDSGFSFTHVIPIYKQKPLLQGVKRLSVGGKLLTNYLKEMVSFRQWNMMDETLLINQVKERLCYCSLDFLGDIKKLQRRRDYRKEIARHWVLPDFVHLMEGYVLEDAPQEEESVLDTSNHKSSVKKKPQQQMLKMESERISVPEVIFRPSDIGINQGGLAEAVMESLKQCPPELQSTLSENIVVTGGSTQFPNFVQRLEQDLRPLVPGEFKIQIHATKDPVLCAWRGGSRFASQPEFVQYHAISRQDYLEHGSQVCISKFQC